MPEREPLTRLVTCQGTAQIVTALAALRQHDRMTRGAAVVTAHDHLLIYGLAVPEDQAQEFVAVIEELALALHPFESVARLTDAEVAGLWQDAQEWRDPKRLSIALQQRLGLGPIDEVYVVRDWQLCNVLILNAFSDATHVCYGDAVGIYLEPGYMASRGREWLSRLLSAPFAWGQSGFPSRRPRLDVSYLLVPGAFGTPPTGKLVRADPTVLRELFARLRPLLDRTHMTRLARSAARKELWVLIASNFCEKGMMTMDNELAAYRSWIEAQRPDASAVLLVKSHPRDSDKKRSQLVESLRGVCCEVFSADAIGSAYMPIEVVLLDLMAGEIASPPSRMEVLTFSTACLAARFVLDLSPRIGFGDELLSKHFTRRRRSTRSRHEAELRRVCAMS